MADDVAGKYGKKAKGHFKQAVKARTAAKLKTALELMDVKTRAYLDTRTKGNDKTHLYLATAFDVIKSSASRIDGITILDPINEGIASVTGLGGASVYRTNISGEGGDYMHEVYCECSEISAREYGLPYVHCVGHAEHLGITPEEIVHCKDTTAGWRRQYEGLEYPMLSTACLGTGHNKRNAKCPEFGRN